jgi:CheY-like chemotaxis protein
MRKAAGAILLVDDNADQLAMATLLLKMEGYTVLSAKNGVEALRILSASAIDCLVTDLFMPEMDGVELIAEMRKRHPMTRVIAISGRTLGRTDYLDTAALIGADATLKKPVSTDDLIATLNRVLASPRGTA